MNNTININLMKNIASKIKSKKQVFEVKPLDIELAKIQLALNKRLERAIPEHGDYTPITESHTFAPTSAYNFSTIKIVIKKSDKKAVKDKLRDLEIHIADKAEQTWYTYTVMTGEKDDIIKTVKDNEFVYICKSVAEAVNSALENRALS